MGIEKKTTTQFGQTKVSLNFYTTLYRLVPMLFVPKQL